MGLCLRRSSVLRLDDTFLKETISPLAAKENEWLCDYVAVLPRSPHWYDIDPDIQEKMR
jgi:hypothetical protein